MESKKHLLVGNSFPLTLFRRKVIVEPVGKDRFVKAAAESAVCSFWGHGNTLKAVEEEFGVSLAPPVERPVITLSENVLPFFDGREFGACWIISPDYKDKKFRPAIGEEVAAEKIAGWNILLLRWVEE